MFARPELPLDVDVGCAHGDFLVEHALNTPDANVVGLEIRRPMIDRVSARLTREQLHDRVNLVCCNANASWRALFADASVRRVFVHFPDPWFKKRHHKRRVMTPDFVNDVAATLIPGGELRFLTDYADYAAEVLEQMRGHPLLENPHGEGQSAPPSPELPQTHREVWHRGQGDDVQRYVWVRRSL